MSPEENELFISIFKIAGQGNDVSEQFYEEDEQTLSIYGNIYQHILMQYVNLVGNDLYFQMFILKSA